MSKKFEPPYAEDVNYWKTGTTAAGAWLDKAAAEIKTVDGVITMQAFGTDAQTGLAAYLLMFQIGDDKFKIVFPVLKTKKGDTKAAQIQAATMLYHDVKAKCVLAKVLGTRSAFFSYLMLPDGRVASVVSTEELAEQIPMMFRLSDRNA